MENQPGQPSPSSIMQIGAGFWASKILLTAVNFHLFTMLAKGAMSAVQIRSSLNLKCSDRHLYDFLDVLSGFGFLKRDGLLAGAKYSNSIDTDAFLDMNKAAYIGGILEMMNKNESKDGGKPFFELIYASPEKLKDFVNAMTGIQIGNFMALAQTFDFSKYKTLVDAGGSAGMLSVMVAKFHPHMNCTSLDLPPVEPIARMTIEQFQFSDRVKAISGDFFNDPLPTADIITMGNILHDWSEEKKIALMKKAFAALPPGGVFIAIENIIDDERSKNIFGMMSSLNMLIETGDGFDYTFSDFCKWAAIAGFSSTAILPLAGPASAAIAYK
jgi:O-methyltransferase domain/Dimerisation domain